MNTISDSLIEKLEELYPKPKPEPVKEEPVVVAETTVPAYTITSGGGYAIQSTNSGITFPATWGTMSSPITNLEEMKVRENSSSYETTLKQYINDKIISLEYRLRDHIKQEIDKLKCSPGTHT
jgi:hypothetical protein